MTATRIDRLNGLTAGPRAAVLARVARFVGGRLRNRPDSEHELIFIRLLLSTSVLVYLLAANSHGFLHEGLTLWQIEVYFSGFLAITVLLFCHLLAWPGESPLRRLVSIPLDLFAFSYIVHIGDASTALLYPVYLWTIFGNGFRYGLPYLFTAAGVGVLAFGTVILTTPFWQTHLSLAGGLLAGLIVLPAYVSVLIRKLSEAKRIAEEASRSKSLFLASVSHELRTPLNAIIGFSDLLTDTALDEEQIDMTQTIGRSGRSLLALINSILDFSRFEVGKMPITRENIDLFAFLNDLRDMLTVQAQTKNIRLALHIGCNVPKRVLASRRLFEEVLINLAGNAVKFTAKGHVLISMEQIDRREGYATLRFEVADTGIGIAPEAQARIFESFTQADASIIDRFGGTGLGLAIAKQQVEAQGGRIGVESVLGHGSTFWFEIEFAVKPGESEPIESDIPVFMLGADEALAAMFETAGAKLGRFASLEELLPWLAAAAQDRIRHPIVFLDESCISAPPESAAAPLLESEIGYAPRLVLVQKENSAALTDVQRAVFLTAIRSPVTDVELAAALAIASSAGKRRAAARGLGTAPSSLALSVLVAEDNRTNQKVIAKILERAGHRVRLVENGQEAIEALAERPFDIVLMDVNMPVLNGIEAARRYRAATVGEERIPILALTADATAEASARCSEAGMDGCVTKPIEAARLIELIDEFCPNGPRADAAEFYTVGNEPAQPHQGEEVAAAIDVDALAALEKLGGRDFVNEIVLQFTGDAATVLRGLSTAVASGDLELFRDRAHALRSCAANVGAQAVYKLCLSWREIDAQEFALHGVEYMTKLEAEFEQAHAALDAYLK